MGPNNSGKSTILGACRVLATAIRHARAKSPEWTTATGHGKFGYRLSTDAVPISLENVHTDLNEEGSSVDFRLSNGNSLQIHFTSDGACYLFPVCSKQVRSLSAFRREFPLTISTVPILGPLEHNEPIVEKDTVSRSLQSHRASRHFRNYWRLFPDGFSEFADLVRRTWPGMDVGEPEKVDPLSNVLMMLCTENRTPRELYWAGLGFQVWCQLLTHISRAQDDALVVIDEPEIYLHPDVQRQLLGILRDLGPDVLVATHSTEIMTEADPSEILLVDKNRRAAKRIKDVAGVQDVLDAVGSLQNITLTRLARNRRVLFVEGDRDFAILRRFARRLGLHHLSTGTDLTHLASEGFGSWERIKSLSWGIPRLGQSITMGAVFDRDFRCDEEIVEILEELRQHLALGHIHRRKEMENYLLVPSALDRALGLAVSDRVRRGGHVKAEMEPASAILARLTESSRETLQGQYVAHRTSFLHRSRRDPASITTETIRMFNSRWQDIESRTEIVDGGDTLRLLRDEAQRRWKVSLTDTMIIDAFQRDEIPEDLRGLLADLEQFCLQAVP